jgi:hypothetical protein
MYVTIETNRKRVTCSTDNLPAAALDAAADAVDGVHDIDTPFRTYAEAAVQAFLLALLEKDVSQINTPD